MSRRASKPHSVKKTAMSPIYVPQPRDIVYLDFSGAKGVEIYKRRPAIVISPVSFQLETGLCLVCPVSHQSHPQLSGFLTIQDPEKRVHGSILIHQLRAVDYQARRAQYIERADEATWIGVTQKTGHLLQIDSTRKYL
ncbi:type II toxin-antitoxin system PemK/MazF family toxin [Listeria valentina]|uniref:type II toxin-antitoxin system PemK/MazF family toxin n=1 Tax=Listeria valentina TaxID=2705293 RepID=UPI001430DD3C|nr:type II toxin-antitoxin system PemK/MazF family toxin [Listeria valentina]